MGQKSLGRGLVDISRMFMTPEEESLPDESSPIFLSTPVRDESCSACLHVIEQGSDPLKCKIFSFKNEENGELFLKSIMPGYAKYCRYFEPLVASEADNEEDIEKIDWESLQYNMEVEETINSHKKIALKDDINLENIFNKMLSQHLEKGYEIVRIDLEKKEENTAPECRIKRHEKVTIYRKESLS